MGTGNPQTAKRAPIEVPQGPVCATVGCRKVARRNGFFCCDECRERTRRLNGTDVSRVSTGGLQVSVGRMLQVLQETPWVLPEVQARRAIARALSERQRARFDHTPDPAIPGQLNLEDAA